MKLAPLRWSSLVCLLAGLGFTTLAQAQANPDEPAPLLVYPYIAVDLDQSVDTWVQLTNVANEPTNVRCFYERTVAECIDGEPDQSCDPQRFTCTGRCVGELRRQAFGLILTSRQPVAWRASAGLAFLPITGVVIGPGGQSNGSSHVPAVGRGPATSTLRCVVVDADLIEPSADNSLVGLATILRREGIAMAEADAAQYRAIGIRTHSDTLDDDELLHLGGTEAEYQACPRYNLLEHYFDGTPLDTGERTSEVSTTLVLTSCTSPGGEAVTQFLVFNEFGQRLSTSLPVPEQLVTPLSMIDTTQPNRSIFSVQVNGTLAGRTLFRAIGDGLHALAIESHRDREIDLVQTAAVEVHGFGQRPEGDVIAFRAPPCVGDCNLDGEVALHEVITSVGIGSGSMPVDRCVPADRDGDLEIHIDEMVSSVASAIHGCPAVAPPPTPTPAPTTTPTTSDPPESDGPEITHFGLATADDFPLEPETTDAEGRPVYVRPFGQGFTLLIEARRGLVLRNIARSTYFGTDAAPDLQVLVSRALGNGDPEVCEEDGRSGGIPATADLDFAGGPAAIAAMNDLGCRAFDRMPGPNAVCTRSNGTRPELVGPFASVAANSEIQFCIPIARAWALPEGDTIIAARVRNDQGLFGEVREIVVRVGEGE